MDSQRICFDLKADQIRLKQILASNFLELEMQAISEGDNRNQTNFSLESMKTAIPTFRNKPILGFFNKDDDFESHNGTWKHDPELDADYFDTANGERILGLIREQDQVQIEAINGKNWITLSCAIWVQYATKQVKRLLKDKHKKVSVEIDIKKAHREEGSDILYIDEFELCGITILGSRNGKPVLEGIAGASLSVLDNLDERVFKQKQALCFAYAELENTAHVDNNAKKEENGTVDMDNLQDSTLTSQDGDPTATSTQSTTDANFACGAGEGNVDQGAQNDCGDPAADAGDPNTNCGPSLNDCGGEGEDGDDHADGEDDADDTHSDNAAADDGVQSNNSLEMQLNEAKEQYAQLQSQYAELEAKYADLEAKSAKYSEDLTVALKQVEDHQDYDAIVAERDSLKQELFTIRCNEMTAQAKELCNKYNIAGEMYDQICAKCQKGEYASFDAVEQDIAMIVFKKLNSVKNNQYQAPISTTIIETGKTDSDKPKTSVDKLRDFVNR
jgi:hypothetical protein